MFSLASDLPQAMRDQYLTSLPEPQEWFLEALVRSGEVWCAPGAGYAVFQGDTLVEFYAVDSAQAAKHLSALLQQRPFSKALGKSFDHMLLGATTTLGWTAVETGYLFRKRTRTALQTPSTFRLDKAKQADLADIWTHGSDFYHSHEEIEQLYHSGGVWVATHNGAFVGSGTMIPIDASQTVIDIGMVTKPDQRRKGYASLIVSALADMLDHQGKRPICGCGPSNLGSKRALENAGFVTEHQLVQISAPS